MDNYLSHWAPNDEPGNTESADMAVVNVSWFSTRVYCRWQGISLPTVIQWEPAAAASETKPYAYDDEVFTRRTMDWYAPPADELRIRCASYLNLFGVRDIHGLMWEWTRDFITAPVSGESRRDSKLQRQLILRTGSVNAADIFV